MGTTVLVRHRGALDETSREGGTRKWRHVRETLKRYLERSAG